MMMVAVIVGILAALAIPNLTRVREKAMVARAIGDIDALQQDITEYDLDNRTLPASLADIGRADLLDPWGRPYVYLPITGKGKGGFRKDRFLVPLNTDYDLYSVGADGATSAPITASVSRDDIIRANDGGFVGLASDF
jgi:general secretion pathway protein G